MGRSLAEIEAGAAEAMHGIEAEWATQARIAQAVADYNAKHATAIPAGLEPLLYKAGLTPEDLQEFYGAQSAEAEHLLETAAPLLQLTDEELTHVDDWRRELLLANAYALPRPQSKPGSAPTPPRPAACWCTRRGSLAPPTGARRAMRTTGSTPAWRSKASRA